MYQFNLNHSIIDFIIDDYDVISIKNIDNKFINNYILIIEYNIYLLKKTNDELIIINDEYYIKFLFDSQERSDLTQKYDPKLADFTDDEYESDSDDEYEEVKN